MGEKLKAARKAAGLSQKQLAEKVGVFQVDISRWENGRSPSIQMLKKLAAALGVSMEDLV